jgi:UDP-4-amino-4,6-dideoxy-N-acetyl-beta-L-altrosamine transaminase/dTDP-4-dehydrorhamnose reductase
MESELKILITGGTGLLAQELDRIYSSLGHSVKRLSRSKVEGSISVNYLNREELVSQVSEIEFDLIINTVAITSVEKCEENFYAAYQANTLIAKNISYLANKLNKKLVHISTDHFTDQNVQCSKENEIGLPLNNYASTKLIGEKEVLQENIDSLIIRTNFFGWGEVRDTFSDKILTGLRENKELKLFKDVFYTPIFIETLSDSIMALVEKNVAGIYNVVSDERISKYEFGIMLSEVFGLSPANIIPVSIKDSGLVQRPLEMSLSNEKLKKEVPSLDLELRSQILKMKEIEGDRKLSASTIKVPSLSYGKQNLIQQDFDYVINNLSSDYLTQGPMVREFETRLASYVGAKYAVAMCNLTCALHAVYLALGLKKGDYFITSPITFVSTSNAGIFCGAIPLFADIDPNTLNIDVKEVEKLFKEYGNKVKGVVPVHFAGAPCEMKELKCVADEYGAWVMEDAAHALGGSYLEGGKIGSCSNSIAAGFSFHPVKNITMGEGGAITTNSEDIYNKLLQIRSHGITKGNDEFLNKDMSHTDGEVNPWYYEMHQLGFNYRITDLQCSLGVSQLSRLNEFFVKRTSIGKSYDRAFSKLKNVILLQPDTRGRSGNHLYVLKIKFEKIKRTRLDLFKEFKRNGINLHVHYIPVTSQPYYAEYETLKNSEDYYNNSVTLPYASSMTSEDVEKVISLITSIIG